MTCDHKRYMDRPATMTEYPERVCMDCGASAVWQDRGGWRFDPWKDPAPAKDAAPSLTPGHRVLSAFEIAQVEVIRKLGVRCAETIDMLEPDPLTNTDPRWVAIARTHFQEGLMAAVRSVTKPEFF